MTLQQFGELFEGIFDSIFRNNPELYKSMRQFNRLREEYTDSVERVRKNYESAIKAMGKMHPEESLLIKEKLHLEELFKSSIKEVENRILTPQRFDGILFKERREMIRETLLKDMEESEEVLYELTKDILGEIAPHEYKTYFTYIGRCPKCHCDTEERRIPQLSHVLDRDFISNPDFFNNFYTQHPKEITCDRCPGEITEPVKTGNLFEPVGPNEFGVVYMLARMKSEGRIIPKFVGMCSGRSKDIRDIRGLMFVCETEEYAKALPKLLLKDRKERYHEEKYLECRDYFDIKPLEEVGYDKYEGSIYRLSLNKKGELERTDVRGSLPALIRIRHKGKSISPKEYMEMEKEGNPDRFESIWARYRAIHTPLEYKDTLIEVQIKDLWNYANESDRESPIFHGTYSKGNDSCAIAHREERREAVMRKWWTPFDHWLEERIADSEIFGKFNPKLYVNEMVYQPKP